MAKWAREIGCSPQSLHQRLSKPGSTVEEAISKPIKKFFSELRSKAGDTLPALHITCAPTRPIHTSLPKDMTMWTKQTVENLRAQLERLYELISDCYASGNFKMYLAHDADLRRVETALDRLTIGRVR